MRPVRFADLVDGPHRGERVRIQWGQPTLFFRVEHELPPVFDVSETAPVPLPTDTIMYCAMERGENMRGRNPEMGDYQIEQWSVDGKRYEYDRLFWAEIARVTRLERVKEAQRVIDSGGYDY